MTNSKNSTILVPTIINIKAMVPWQPRIFTDHNLSVALHKRKKTHPKTEFCRKGYILPNREKGDQAKLKLVFPDLVQSINQSNMEDGKRVSKAKSKFVAIVFLASS
ncbi:hypothetical protein EPI10_017066 [Gossypium australe]|uniref:Uncharacterized protein n=1 Tax=Gossypium australe TaxID=47621 RepID=A0A5B6VQV3_9ROSI|nr:hypothetical protein EPI10_017066 [Gossypium australe]